MGKVTVFRKEAEKKAHRLAAAVLEGESPGTVWKAHAALAADLRRWVGAGSSGFYSDLAWMNAVCAAAERGRSATRRERPRPKGRNAAAHGRSPARGSTEREDPQR